jgi:hypothetical protein
VRQPTIDVSSVISSSVGTWTLTRTTGCGLVTRSGPPRMANVRLNCLAWAKAVPSLLGYRVADDDESGVLVNYY